MADEENILGGKLSLEDNYSSALSRFANKVLGAENRFKQFADKVLGNNNRIGKGIDKLGEEIENIVEDTNGKIVKHTQKTIQEARKEVAKLAKEYKNAGMSSSEAWKKAWENVEYTKSPITPNPKGGGSSGYNQIKDFAQSFLSGGIGGVVGKLGLIGTGVMATVSVLKKIDGAMDTGFDILNRLSDNMFSYEGIKESLGTAMSYQSTRSKLDLFYGSEEEGREAYKLASKVALDTFADPGSLAEAMAIMRKNGIYANEADLYSYLDMVGSRGDGTTAKEVGLAIEDAMNGEWERLKEYSITTTKLKKYLEELKKTDKATYKELKNTFNKQGSVTDPQKAYKLIMNYVRNSPINGYAEQYAKTAQGSLDNLTGLWEQIKVSIMGLDDAGNVIEGSALFHFSEMVNNLKETLGSDSATKGFGEISKGVGEGFKAFGEAFDDVLEKTDWEKVATAITESIDVISDSLINLSESGALQDLAENLPKIVQSLVNNKIIEGQTKVQIATDVATGKWYNVPLDFVGEMINKFVNWFNPDMYSTDQTGMTDLQVIKLINSSDLTIKQKHDMTDLIKTDNLPYYNIHIERIEANNFDEIMESLKQAQANRR